MIKALIFDFAGVIGGDGFWQWLLDRQDLLFQKKEKFEELALSAARGEITSLRLVERLAQETGESERDVWNGITEKCAINTELVAWIRTIKPVYKTALLTNFSHDWLEKILADNELSDLFDPLVISSRVKKIKPEPEVFQIMLDLLHLSAEETIFIDDRLGNVEAAKRLKMHALLFDSNDKLQTDLKTLGILAKK